MRPDPCHTGLMPKLNLRLPDDLYALLKAAAEADERSMNGEALWILKQALEAR